MSRMKGLPAKKEEEEFYQGILLSAADIYIGLFFFLLGLLIFRSRGPPKQRDLVPFFLSLLICRREPTYK